jgi:hypothetical protein
MPSIATFIKELLTEDKYSGDFIDRVEERIQGLNAAQLQGIYNHLKVTSKEAKAPLWKAANTELMSKIEGILKIRTDEVHKEKKLLEEYYIKQRQKKQTKVIAAKEKIRVMEMVVGNARRHAEEDVKELELKRQTAERVAILQEIAKAEDRRDFWWKVLAAFYVFALGGVCYAMRAQLFILIPAVFFLTLVCLFLAYRAHLWTDIKPIVFTEDQIENQIEQKAEVFRKQALSDIRERERKFQERTKRENKERRKLRKEKKAKDEQEIELLENERLERIAQAKMLLAKSMRESEQSNRNFLFNNHGGNPARVIPVSDEYMIGLDNQSLSSSIQAVVDSDSETKRMIQKGESKQKNNNNKTKKKKIRFIDAEADGKKNNSNNNNEGEEKDLEAGVSSNNNQQGEGGGDGEEDWQMNDYLSSTEDDEEDDDLESSLEEEEGDLSFLDHHNEIESQAKNKKMKEISALGIAEPKDGGDNDHDHDDNMVELFAKTDEMV